MRKELYMFFFSHDFNKFISHRTREKTRYEHRLKTWESFLRQASCIHGHANGAVFYDLRYRRDVFTHKSHRIAIELSQSARSDLLDASNDGYLKKRFTRTCLRAWAHMHIRGYEKNICTPPAEKQVHCTAQFSAIAFGTRIKRHQYN